MNKQMIVIPLQIKSLDEGTGTFVGYGAVFGNTDSYGDVIVKGAFQNYLTANKPSDVKMLWQHDSRVPIGIYEDIKEDVNGLLVKGRLLINEVEKAREAYALLKAGAISGLSIGYTINKGGASIQSDGKNYLTDLKLWEISVVTFPANDQANVESVKSIKTVRDFENFLRDVGGFSASLAKRIAVQGFKAVCGQREVDADDADLIAKVKKLSEKLKQG
jgi:HK97 family phage prohead protease